MLVPPTDYKQKVPANSQDGERQGYFMISLWGESNLNLKKTNKLPLQDISLNKQTKKNRKEKKMCSSVRISIPKDVSFLF